MYYYFGAILLTVIANVLYHIFQKFIDSGVNPFVSLICTYCSGLVVCFFLLPFFGREALTNPTVAFGKVGWSSFALGGAIVLLELGFLLVYRTKWDLSTAALYSNVLVTLVLLPIGLLFFGEKVTMLKTIGLIMALLGLILLGVRGDAAGFHRSNG